MELKLPARSRVPVDWLWGGLSFSGAILLAFLVRSVGPLAVSDDDFARVVIAQGFALEPRWDPSGTSWLPVPFYFDGAATSLLGQDLGGARASAIARTGIGTLLLFGAGRLLGLTGLTATLCALFPLLLPTTRVFTIATVPEYFTACLATFASVALRRKIEPERMFSWAGVGCLGLATLSRYETWPFALTIAITLFWSRRREDRIRGILCLLGPFLWLCHGALRHGSSLFFVDRVRSYKIALGGDTRTQVETLISYISALWKHEPLLLAIVLIAILSQTKSVRRAGLLLLTPALGQLTFLSLADMTSSAPTHHPERAVMVFWTTLPLLFAWSLEQRLRSSRQSWLPAVALIAAAGLNFFVPRAAPDYVQRGDEERVGQALRNLQRGIPERTLIASLDFSYLATMAAAGHPDRFVALTSGDPRTSSREPIVSRLRRALASSNANWLVMPLCFDPEALQTEGGPSFETRFESKEYRILKRARSK